MSPRAHASPIVVGAGVAPGCQACTAPTGDDGGLCRTCTRTLGTELDSVPDLWTDLGITATGQDHIAAASERPSGNVPLPWNEHAVQASIDLHATLTMWGGAVADIGQDERDPWAGGDPVVVSAWLKRNITTLRHHPNAGECHDDIRYAIARGRHAIDTPDIRTRFEVGPCPDDITTTGPDGDTTAACGGQVWATIPSSDDRPAALRCQSCGASWNTIQWLRVGHRMLARIRQLRHTA